MKLTYGEVDFHNISVGGFPDPCFKGREERGEGKGKGERGG
jgi:hypothetical protein